MVSAIILLKVECAHVNSVAEQLIEFPGIQEVFSTGGKYDLAALARVAANETLAELVTERISGLPGITYTETMIAFRVYSRNVLDAGFSLGGTR